MNVRGKMVYLVKNALRAYGKDLKKVVEPYEFIADFLIHSGVTVQEWIPVDERLPEEKVNCIVHYKHAYCDNDNYWAIGICFYDGEKFQMDWSYKITHWMPLPKPPKGE